MNKKIFLLLFTLCCSLYSFAQDGFIKHSRGGILAFGSRSTFSAFNDGKSGNVGTGVGGQFRIQFSDRVNTDWFADYITGNEGNYANRQDAHIGWSVLYYVKKPQPELPKVQPYVLAGHCFDYSHVAENRNATNYAERWSSAVQAGIGAHYNLTQRFDISGTLQYMIHLSNDIESSNEGNAVVFTKEPGVDLVGHLLLNISLNYKVIDLW